MFTQRNYLLVICIFVSSMLTLTAQKPQKILGIAKEDKTISYYQQQAKLWQQLTQKDPKNAEAWHYYYKAERSKAQLQNPKWVNDQEGFYAKLQPILQKAKKHIGNSFEYHYIQGMNAKGDRSIQAFTKAYEIDPDRSEVYGWLFTHYFPLFKEKQLKDLAKRMLKANIYSNANLKWNYNALQSAQANAVFISNGDMDGLPKLVLQYGQGVRKDILTVSKWFLAQFEDYRATVFKKLGIPKPSKKQTQFQSLSDYADYLAAYILKTSKRPAYISAGTPIQFFRDQGIKDNIYLVGNALKYAQKDFDNTAIIKQNIEEKYFLEYLLNNFQQHPEDEIVKTQMNLTYLPAFVHMKKHYQKKKKTQKVDFYNRLIERIASESGRKEEVLKWFEK